MYDDLQLEPSSTVDRAADEIRRAMFAGQLTPGTPLREVALSEAMGVGRSTIREALAILVAEGMAVRVPNKGVAVKELECRRRPRREPRTAGARERRRAAWPEADEADRQVLRDALARYVELAAGVHATRPCSPRHTCRSTAPSSA